MSWLLLIPAVVFLAVLAYCVLTAEDDPQEPREVEWTPGSGWRLK